MSKYDKLVTDLAGKLTEIRQVEKAKAEEADRKAAEAEEAFRKRMEEDPEYKAFAEWKDRRPGTDKRLDKDMQETDAEYKGRKVAQAAPRLYTKNPQAALAATKFYHNIVQAYIRDDYKAKAALAEGTDELGGYLVPEETGDRILRYAEEQSVAMQEAYVVNTSREKFSIPMEANGVSVYKIAENSTISGTNPTFTEVELSVDLYGCIIVSSNQLLTDNAFDLVDHLDFKAGGAFARRWDQNTFNDGTDWTPLFGNCGATVDGTTLTKKVFLDAEAEVAVNERSGCKWYVSRQDFADISDVSDDNGQPLFRDPKNGGYGLYGYPVVVVEELTAGKMYFANMKRAYIIAKRQGLTLDVSSEAGDYFAKNQTGFRYIARNDGNVALVNTAVQITLA